MLAPSQEIEIATPQTEQSTFEGLYDTWMSINIKKRWALCIAILCANAYMRTDSNRKLKVSIHTFLISFKVSFTRRVSQLTSVLTNTPLPPYIRAVFYKTYGTFTGVKFEEAVV